MNVRLSPLPYALDALEPHLSRRTLAQHHGTHHRAHVDRTRQLIENTWREYSPLQVVVRESAAGQEHALFSAAAQAWNHAFYWSSMHPAGGGEANGRIAELMEASFGTQSVFARQFIAAVRDHSGSGWIWLVLDGERLRILTTGPEDTALILAVTPLLTIEVSGHAYYADYQERRADYASAFMAHLVNWNFANRNLAEALSRRRRPSWQWGRTLRPVAKEMPVRDVSSEIAPQAQWVPATASRASGASRAYR